MEFLKSLFRPTQRTVHVFENLDEHSTCLTYLPRTGHAPPREYLFLMHARAKLYKKTNRNSRQYAVARAEARLTEWVYHSWRHGTDLELTLLRIKNYKAGWPVYTVRQWQNSARVLSDFFGRY